MKISILTSKYPEPSETFILNEVLALDKVKEFEVDVVSLKKSDVESHVRVHYPNLLSVKNLFSFLKYFLVTPKKMFSIGGSLLSGFSKCPRRHELLKSFFVWPVACSLSDDLKKNKTNLIIAHWANVPSTVAWIIKNLGDIDYIFQCHGENISTFWPHLSIKCKEAKAIFSCTKTNALKIEHETGKKVCYLPHGTKLESDDPVIDNNEGKLIGLSVGRLVKTKGFHVVIEALKKIKEKSISFHWHIVGDGPEYAALKKLVNSYRLEENISFDGWIEHSELQSFYKRSDCLVMPCEADASGDHDGLPNVILEAMVQKCLVVSTPISDIPSVIIDRETGLLIEPGDSIGLSHILEEIHLNDKNFDEIKRQARKKVEETFSFDACINQSINSIKKAAQQ